MRPLVAVTTTLVPEAGPYRRPQISLYEIYVRVLERIGLTTILVTPTHREASLPVLLDRCDGLVLTGGEDIDPARYGEAPLPGLGLVNPARDAAELTTLNLALERELPVLGICRGCQLINVGMGGTLYQDLATQAPSRVRHRQVESWESRTHRIRIVPGSRLAQTVAREVLLINSFHHQGIKDVAPGLVITATAEDGAIEAVESAGEPWILGVQWHPERHEADAPETDPDRRIIAAFREAVMLRASGRGPDGRELAA
ncbi:MAG TPA: gamma-glutamyl-gamma-aminobutyrate hydrolase family protein [Longimicrobiales bacterium]